MDLLNFMFLDGYHFFGSIFLLLILLGCISAFSSWTPVKITKKYITNNMGKSNE